MSDSVLLEPSRLVFRDTASRFGRHVQVTPKNSALEHLHYGRIRFGGGIARVSFETGTCEVGLICLSGMCEVRVDGRSYCLGQYDAIYVPRESVVEVGSLDADLVEVAAPVEGDYPVQVVRFADVRADKSLHFRAGADGSRRELNVLLGPNIQAGRIVAGYTRSDPGNWTSWPPHEHAALEEELYVFVDMPAPSFGVQCVFTDPGAPELVTFVKEGDAVAMPRGYHPNSAIPGHTINFVWLMAARRERTDRVLGVVNVLPGFGKEGSGLESAAVRR
jgi:5-deoxy-glucuronate isomerase